MPERSALTPLTPMFALALFALSVPTLVACDKLKSGSGGVDSGAIVVTTSTVATPGAAGAATTATPGAIAPLNPATPGAVVPGAPHIVVKTDGGASPVVATDGGAAPVPTPTPHAPNGLPTTLPSGFPTTLPSNIPHTLPSGLPSNLPWPPPNH